MDKKAVKGLIEDVSRLVVRAGGGAWTRKFGDEQPLRAELFSIEQLEQHAKSLAGWHEVDPRPGKDRLLPRLTENESVLISTYELLMAAMEQDRRIAPAGEWLLDNFYLIEEQIRTIRRHFPRSYSRELPRLLNGPLAGFPRVYEIALELISHGDGRVDAKSLSSFVAAYQIVTPLRLGELWAIPIMLRLALIENLRRVASRIASGRNDRDAASYWADRMIEVAEKEPKDLILEMADMARSNPPTSTAFISELARRLQGQSSALALPISWIEQRLSEQGMKIEQLVQIESQQQAADQVSIGNTIGSLRFLAAMDWREFVETMSVIEKVLRTDPNGAYANMDFATRDRYRHVVEKIAKRTKTAEEEVASKVITLSQEKASVMGPYDRTAHVGYFLAEKGLPSLERAMRMRHTPGEAAKRVLLRFPLAFYLGMISVLIAALVFLTFDKMFPHTASPALLWGFGSVLVLCLSRFAIGLVNWFIMAVIPPRPLPRMDFSEGIPSTYRTMVVVPAMIDNKRDIDGLIEGLEVRYLANRDPNLFFGLLTDFYDAAQETTPEDDELLRYMKKSIEGLNRKYASAGEDVFFAFHRPRLWNPEEGAWMAYERKRGKLIELNRILRGKGDEGNGYLAVGDVSALGNVKYVITLDTDTHMPIDSARVLVGTMAHPLNAAIYDEKKKRVTDGYGILQPRVNISMSSSSRSWFVKIFGGEPGIDPYTLAVSDVYQDFFGEGSFVGKGIYDIDIFTRALDGRFPDNLILSHDLLEGCYARAGLVSDVQLFEEYPSSYISDVNRRHRWIRGDWQIIAWLLPKAPGYGGQWIRNPITAVSRWKIFDNLRRSLVMPAMTLMLLAGWALTGNAWFWSFLAFGIMLAPQLAISASELLRKPKETLFGAHVSSVAGTLAKRTAQSLFFLVTLPYDAYFSIDAVTRSLLRMLVTRRKMLEWVTSSDMKRLAHTGLGGFYASMWVAPATAAAMTAFFFLMKREAFSGAAVFLAAWAAAPAVAWWASRTRPAKKVSLRADENVFLRIVARRTWRFFEEFVSPENNWLPPDNYQETPHIITARRTSPTNIGLALLSNLAAYDFCYISPRQLLEKTSRTMEVMEKLERFKGNFYNWYDTRTLRPLHPLYVSTVDSGNLAAALLVLKQGLLQLRSAEVVPGRVMDGVSDTARMIEEIVFATKNLPPGITEAMKNVMREISATDRGNPAAVRMALGRIASLAPGLFPEGLHARHSDLKWWADALARQCLDWASEIDVFLPWTETDVPESIWRSASPEQEKLLQELKKEIEKIKASPKLADLARADIERFENIYANIARRDGSKGADRQERDEWFERIISLLKDASVRAMERISLIDRTAQACDILSDMEFDFLYDRAYDLLTIGYSAAERRADPSCYDLLASEARLTSFIGIALGHLPQEHWFALGRLLTSSRGEPVLLSWGGSMFEYLMPLLVMPTYDDTLIDRTYKAVVAKQMEYASQRGVPWGISESGYNTTDAQMNYQYRAFGVPDLGFKRGLADDLVIAPYASVMALMVAPRKAYANLVRMRQEGFMGRYGFYEAVDYTPSRLPHGQTSPAVVKSFMAHHEGMSFLSLAYILLDRPMQKRFIADPKFQAAELLLQERVPKSIPFHPHSTEAFGMIRTPSERESLFRVFNTPQTPIPEIHLLSNGRYTVMITNAGGGYSRWKDLEVTRWREDTTRDSTGTFCYIRDLTGGDMWSVGYQPTMKMPRHYEAIFSQGKAEFRRKDKDVTTHAEITVSPEDDIELRRMHITNTSRYRKVIELTSYAEVVIAPPEADAAHTAFSKLFVKTEIVRPKQAVLCYRRKRSKEEATPFMLHLVAIHATAEGEVSYETDRSKFVGRGRRLTDPDAMRTSEKLSDTEGSVLDPVVATRCRVVLEPEETATIDLVFGMAETREKAMELIEKYRDRNLADRVFDLAWTHGQIVLQHFNATEADAQLFGRLASSIIYPSYFRRVNPAVILKNKRGQSGLWGYSISGDLPIVLVRIADQANIDLVRQMLKAHAYWRMKGLVVDLIIWNEDHSGYRQVLQDKIVGMITSGTEAHFLDRPGGIFIRRLEQIAEEDRVLMLTAARIIIADTRGTLAEQIDRRGQPELNIPHLQPIRVPKPAYFQRPQPRRDLLFFNGIGGFTKDGREYVITVAPGVVTPAPWVNVIANPFFGTVVTESGGAHTWSENSGLFRLTPWYNDPITDLSGEAIYIRDEESGRFWSPTPLPAPGALHYVVRHGCGYTVFEHSEDGISTEMWSYAAIDAPVKFFVIKLKNGSGRARALSATAYFEMVLGEMRSKAQMHVITEIDPKTGALFIRNPYNTDFEARTAFVDVNESVRTVTGDRTEFLGRNGSSARPAAMSRTRLSNRVGAGFDPCAAVQAQFDLADGQEKEIVFLFGCGKSTEEAREVIANYRGSGHARNSLEAVWGYWNHTLGAVYVDTPDQSVNVMVNGWLLYQTIACRMWARGAYYQSGGAFGFRDQLQDAMALVHSRPEMLRQQILLAASRQFKEGDVQHWWHVPLGAGVRTRISDDLLWLPLAAARYVAATGDTGVLEERVNFLEGRPLKPEEDSYYDKPPRSEEAGTLYEHCVKAIKKGLSFGEHGLPLMGGGDWNDGMNLVGAKGKGESVWLAFFLYAVLGDFREVAIGKGDADFAQECREEAELLKGNIEKSSWDGKWYLRAFFDDGSPLGSSQNPECQIDSIPQSWAVISSAGDETSSMTAMGEVDRRLVRRDGSLIQLFSPPFDTSDLDPGYIKGYLPGVRENAGQYTHAAVWVIMAFAMLGDRRKAWELLDLINPVNHGASAREISVYKVEPYVMAADVYAVAPHEGRGGWTWYTGSAGWMYRLVIEYLLGIRLEADKLCFKPCLPEDWKKFTVHYRYRETVYHLNIEQTGPGQEIKKVELDGDEQPDKCAHLADDHREHNVRVEIG